ncbi:MAG: putative ABC transporter permease [Eubacteriales bacterium]|jgi:hypothetical protein
MKQWQKYGLLALAGGIGYNGVELLWRGYSHWSMTVTGGICLLLLWTLQQRMADQSLWKRCVMGMILITAVEFLVGCVVNLVFCWEVWDYTDAPCNLLGQVCLPYSLLWGLLCAPVFWGMQTLGRLRRERRKPIPRHGKTAESGEAPL